MVAQEPSFLEDLINTTRGEIAVAHQVAQDASAAIHKRCEGVESFLEKTHSRLDVLHDKLNVALSAISHLIQRTPDMAAIHDQIASTLDANDTVISGISASATALAALKNESDSASADLLTKVQNQGATLASIKAAIDADIAADTPAPAASTSTDTSTTAAPVVGASSTTVTNADGSTSTLDHATGATTTTDSTGAAVPTDPTVAATLTSAATDAGVAVPSA